MSRNTGSKVALWVAIGILGLIVLGGIALFAVVFMFMRSEEGQKFTGTIGTLQRVERVAPDIVEAFKAYIDSHKTFPESIEELKGSMPASSYEVCKELFTYRRPASEDPDTTPILWTPDMDMMMGGKVRVEILKNFTARQVQTMPIPLAEKRAKEKLE